MNNKTKVGFRAFLLGGLIGAVVGLLYAPQSGEETRQSLADEGQELMNKTKASVKNTQEAAISALQDTQTRMEALYQDTRERLGKLQEIAKGTLNEQKESLEKGYSNAKEVVAG
jgi:gas vesicle protein